MANGESKKKEGKSGIKAFIVGPSDPEYLKEAFKQSWEDWRHYNSIIWQLPGVATAIVGGLLGVAYYAVVDPLPRALVVTLAACFSLAMVIALVKHRKFHTVRTELIEYVSEKELGLADWSPIRGNIAQKTKWTSRAYSYLLFSMIALFAVTMLLAASNLINWLSTL